MFVLDKPFNFLFRPDGSFRRQKTEEEAKTSVEGGSQSDVGVGTGVPMASCPGGDVYFPVLFPRTLLASLSTFPAPPVPRR